VAGLPALSWVAPIRRTAKAGSQVFLFDSDRAVLRERFGTTRLALLFPQKMIVGALDAEM
jgi:hypothetical protein